MVVRKWLIRSLIPVLLAAIVVSIDYINGWVKPSFVREQLLAELSRQFVGVDIEVSSVRMRLFGGMVVNDLKLIRSSDTKRIPFLTVSRASLLHDKEQLANGKLVLRKIEMESPTFVLERDERGQWVLPMLLNSNRSKSEADQPIPAVVATGATIRYVDRRYPDAPTMEVREASLTLVNDPINTIRVVAKGGCPRVGPFTASLDHDRTGGRSTAHIEMKSIPIDASLMDTLAALSPELAPHLRRLEGSGSVLVDLAYTPASGPGSLATFSHDVRLELRRGRLEHPLLPMALSAIELKARVRNSGVQLESLRADAGDTRLGATFDLPLSDDPRAADGLTADTFYEKLRDLTVSTENVEIDDALFARLPPKFRQIQTDLAPAGRANIYLTLSRQDNREVRRVLMQPQGMSAMWHEFRYPLAQVRGLIEHVARGGQPDKLTVDLSAKCGGQPLTFKGSVTGTGAGRDVDLAIEGQNIPLDEAAISALPDQYPQMLRKLRARGRIGISAKIRFNDEIRREYGQQFDNEFEIRFSDGHIDYEDFPYPLDDLKGTLIVRTVPAQPTRLPPTPGVPASLGSVPESTGLVVFRDFEGRNGGGIIRLKGSRDSKPGVGILDFDIEGENVAFNDDLRRAFAALKLGHIWDSFSPRGRMNCRVLASVVERPGMAFDPRTDLRIGVGLRGVGIKPASFPWQLDDVRFKLAYGQGVVHVEDFQATHQATRIGIRSTVVELFPTGGFATTIRDLEVGRLDFDYDLLKALPDGIRSGFESLQPRGPMTLRLHKLSIVDVPRADDGGGNLPPDSLPPRPPNPASVASSTRPVSYSVPVPQTVGVPLPRPGAKRSYSPTVSWDLTLLLQGCSIKAGVTWENVQGRLGSSGTWLGTKMGEARGNLWCQSATILKQPVREIYAGFEIEPDAPDALVFKTIRAKLYGGEVGGQARLQFSSPMRYDLRLNATRIDLEEVARAQHLGPKVKISGEARAKLFVSNRDEANPNALPILQGRGSIDIDDGRLLNLPFTLNLLKVLGGRVPDETAFEQAHILFAIRGNRLIFGQLDLLGNALSLGGQGEMNLDGSDLRLEFYAIWSNMLAAMAIEPIENLLTRFSQNLFRIVVSGRADGKMNFEREIVPVIVDPIKRLIGRK